MTNNSKFRYPSWREWWISTFPDGLSCPTVCMFKNPLHENKLYCNNITCDECINMIIPDDIAEKLGIEPIEYVEDDEEDGSDD